MILQFHIPPIFPIHENIDHFHLFIILCVRQYSFLERKSFQISIQEDDFISF